MQCPASSHRSLSALYDSSPAVESQGVSNQLLICQAVTVALGVGCEQGGHAWVTVAPPIRERQRSSREEGVLGDGDK